MGKLLKKLGCGTWLSVLLAWLMCPLPSLADDLKPQYCIDNPDCYSVELRGNNTIVIKMPVYNKVDTDSWAVEPSELYIEYDGGRWNRILGYGTVEKNIAANIYRILKESKTQGLPLQETERWVIDQINAIDGLEVEYYSIVDGKTLEDIQKWTDSEDIVGCITVYCGKTPIRLIDHIRYK